MHVAFSYKKIAERVREITAPRQYSPGKERERQISDLRQRPLGLINKGGDQGLDDRDITKDCAWKMHS